MTDAKEETKILKYLGGRCRWRGGKGHATEKLDSFDREGRRSSRGKDHEKGKEICREETKRMHRRGG